MERYEHTLYLSCKNHGSYTAQYGYRRLGGQVPCHLRLVNFLSRSRYCKFVGFCSAGCGALQRRRLQRHGDTPKSLESIRRNPLGAPTAVRGVNSPFRRPVCICLPGYVRDQQRSRAEDAVCHVASMDSIKCGLHLHLHFNLHDSRGGRILTKLARHDGQYTESKLVRKVCRVSEPKYYDIHCRLKFPSEAV